MFLSYLALFQGIYYALAGLWALISMRTFVAVTGPKTDLWLVRTVGVLVLAIGHQLVMSAHHNEADHQAALAIGCALGLAAVEFYYTARRRIRFVYAIDAVLQVAFAVAWVWALHVR